MKLFLKSIARIRVRYLVAVSLLLILFGIFAGSHLFLDITGQSNSQAFRNPSLLSEINKTSTAKSNEPLVSGMPNHITIPSVNISITVDPGVYNKTNQTWSLSLTDAEYATVTPPPNNLEGNTFIYGHNRWAVFYKLLNINIGDEATVTTANNHTFTYKLISEKVTNPTDTSLFSYRGKPILTLQTCSGLFYQNRQFFIFNLVSYT
jgi:LPXTG-site transpeptidase (sortase) family protein